MKTLLIVRAHPEPTALTHQLADTAREVFTHQGHRVLETDLYALGWKAVLDPADFPARQDPQRFDPMAESGAAYAQATQTADVVAEQQKLAAADGLLLHFPLWWYGFPAILKGWVDRVYAYGLAYSYQGQGNRYRYGQGAFAGKRAMLVVTTGGPEADYGPRGINGPLDQLLFPITHGILFFPGFTVLPTFAVYDVHRQDPAARAATRAAWARRVAGFFTDTPLPFRPQHRDYPDGQTLAPHILPGQGGLGVHLGE